MSFPNEIEADLKLLYITDEYGAQYLNPKVQPSDRLIRYFKENYGIKAELHRMCQVCQIQQIAKYHDLKDPEYNPDRFHVRCDGVIAGLPGHMRESIQNIATQKGIEMERAQKLVLSTIDPVAWAELLFGFDDDEPEWRLRPYQKEQLRCTAKRLVFRQGRRSGKSFAMALKMLFLAYNMKISKGRDGDGNPVIKGPQIEIITPFQSQITNLFSEMEQLLLRNHELLSRVTTGTKGSVYIKTPFYHMKFDNGAEITGFVTGIGLKQDGSGGGTIRGSNADVIYMDEMDMIPDDIIQNAVKPLLLTRPGVMMFGTSTPIGKRSHFYEWSTKRPDFREYYYPSTVLPNWDEVRRDTEGTTQEGFKSEYLAQFIDGAHGVFKPTHIHAARADYVYKDTEELAFWRAWQVPERTDLIKCIGIDWNKNAGSEFVVVAYDPHTKRFFVVEASNVSSGSYSAEGWKEEVRRLNFKWKPEFIYADEGYGHTIIEDLRYEAHRLSAKKTLTRYDQETIKIPERLKSFNFSSSVLLRDPITQQELSKPGKHFLVETLVRVFEAGQIKFPESDMTLVKQLGNYIVLRMSETTGKPVYGPENAKIADHRLDALMLAVGGIYLERSVYAHDSGVISKPEFFSKEELARPEDQFPDTQQQSAGLQKAIRDHRLPGYYSVLQMLRGGPEEDKLARQKLAAQEFLKNPPRHPRGRRGVFESNQAPEAPPEAYAVDQEDLWKAQRINEPRVVPRHRKETRQFTKRGR